MAGKFQGDWPNECVHGIHLDVWCCECTGHDWDQEGRCEGCGKYDEGCDYICYTYCRGCGVLMTDVDEIEYGACAKCMKGEADNTDYDTEGRRSK